MNKKSLLLTLIGLLTAAPVLGATRLFISNKTSWNFDLAMTQEGQSLKPGRWQASAPKVAPEQQVEFGRFSRGAGIKRGKRYLFRTYATAYVNGKTCQIELLQYLRGTVFHSHMWQGARADVYQDPGLRDDREIGKTFTECAQRTIGITYQAKADGTDDDIYYSLEDHGPVAPQEEKSTLELMTYNVYMRPSELFRNAQEARADAIVKTLIDRNNDRRIDSLILVEVFDDDVREYLVNKLKPILPYSSNTLGTDRFLEQDGGVIVLSRGPILYERQALFGSLCARTFEDCLSDKGGIFVTTLIDGKRFNLIATHLQAGGNQSDVKVRRQQIQYLDSHKRIFFSAMEGKSAPTFMGGDMNVALGTEEYDLAYAETWFLPALVKVPFPDEYRVVHANPLLEFINSFDRRLNKLATDGATEWLDYFLYDRENGEVELTGEISVEVLRGKNDMELSDHFPVRASFRF